MNARSKKILFYVFVVVIITAALNMYLRLYRYETREVTLKISSLKQVYLWILEYEMKNGHKPKSLEPIIKMGMDNIESKNEFKILLDDLNSGKVYYNSDSKANEVLIYWIVKDQIIKMNEDGTSTYEVVKKSVQ